MPVQLVKGQVTLLVDYTVCEEGDVLSSEQARILKLLGKTTHKPGSSTNSFSWSGHQHAEFKLNMVSGWNKAEGEFKLFKEIEMREPNTAGRGSGGEAEDSDDNFEDDDDE